MAGRTRAALGGSVPAVAVAGLVWLALFAILYTAGDAIGAWPKLPPGSFQNVDLVVGLAAGVALIVALLWPERRKSHA